MIVDSNMRFVKESNLLIGCCKIRYWGADSMILAYLEEQVDLWRAMLYGDNTFHSCWSGDEMFKSIRTSRSHRDQVQFGAAPCSVVSPLGSLIPSSCDQTERIL